MSKKDKMNVLSMMVGVIVAIGVRYVYVMAIYHDPVCFFAECRINK